MPRHDTPDSPRRRALLLAAGTAPIAAGLSRDASAQADNWPVKPVRMLMPNAPGSAIDTLGRIIGQKLGEVLGQQVIIDNRAGAGGVIGMEIGKNANPDGYTVIFASPPSLTVAPYLLGKPPFDPLADFSFVSTLGVTPNLLVVNNVSDGRVFGEPENEVTILGADGSVEARPRATKAEVADGVWDAVVRVRAGQ